MKVLEKLASSLNRRDEVPNQELALEIFKKNDHKAITELIEYLDHKSKDIQHDCIKVLYEVAYKKPELISDYAKKFIELLDHKSNRMQWGAMTALASITLEKPDILFKSLSKIINVADKGTVITKDHAMNILIALMSLKKYSDDAFALFNEQLQTSLPNQLPSYAEKAMMVISEKNKIVFIKTLQARLGDIEKDTKRVRIEKVMHKLLKQK